MSELITLTDPRAPAAEAYRRLRTNLSFARPDRPLRTLLVAAPSPEADATTVLANLAVVIAQADRRVTAIDCDLRRPSLHKLFGLPNERGLTDALVGDDPTSAPVQDTGVPGLRVLTSGPTPPNPAELLGTHRMQALLEQIAERSDLVLCAAPPVVAVTDAAVLAPRLDGTLLVLKAGESRRDTTSQARTTLEQVGAEVIGVVLTGVDVDETTYAYGSDDQ